MRKFQIFAFLLILVVSFTGCIKNDDIVLTQKFAEIDAASWNANAGGVTYPILTRKVPENRPISTTLDSTLRRLSGTVRVRVNLVGAQSDKEETVRYTVFSSPIASISFPATISGQTPTAAAGTLAVSDAIAGTHYAALSGTVTIPAKSSFGYIDINVLAPAATPGQGRFLGIELTGGGSIAPSVNYSKVGLVIDQR